MRKTNYDNIKYDLAMAKRLRDFRVKHVHKIQDVAADMIGIGQSTLSLMEIAKRPITHLFIFNLEHRFNLNREWILSGELPMVNKVKVKTNTFLDVAAMTKRIDDLEMQVKILTATVNKLWYVVNGLNNK